MNIIFSSLAPFSLISQVILLVYQVTEKGDRGQSLPFFFSSQLLLLPASQVILMVFQVILKSERRSQTKKMGKMFFRNSHNHTHRPRFPVSIENNQQAVVMEC